MSKSIAVGKRTQHLYSYLENAANQNTGNLKAVVYSTVFHAPNLPIVRCTYICSTGLCRSPCLLWHGIKRLFNAFSWLNSGISHLSLNCIVLICKLFERPMCLPRKYIKYNSLNVLWFPKKKRCTTTI